MKQRFDHESNAGAIRNPRLKIIVLVLSVGVILFLLSFTIPKGPNWMVNSRQLNDLCDARNIYLGLILSRVQDETNPLVLLPSSFVARSFQTAAGMRLARVSPAGKNPARLNLILKAH